MYKLSFILNDPVEKEKIPKIPNNFAKLSQAQAPASAGWLS
jgi:hypothetical protein